MRVAITGASGLIGTALAGSLRQDGHQVIKLVRRSPQQPDQVSWDPQASDGGVDPATFDGVDAVVHLSGAPVAGGWWTRARKRELADSRIQSTRALVTAIGKAATPPAALLCGSAVGWYGDTGSREVDESAPAGTGFLARPGPRLGGGLAGRPPGPAGGEPALGGRAVGPGRHARPRWPRCSGSGSGPGSDRAASTSAG